MSILSLLGNADPVKPSQHLILLHRPENSGIPADKKSAQSTAFTAAKKIGSIVDDFLALGLLRQSQLQM